MSDIVDRLLDTTDRDRIDDAIQEITALRAEIGRLRAALREIDQQRYTGRNTINPDNAYEMAVAINAKLLAVMDIARAALKEDGDD